MPYTAVTDIYNTGDAAARAAVSPHIICRGGRASDLDPADRCAAGDLERVQIDLVNWPGLKTTGIDTHFATRVIAGSGVLSLGWDSTYTLGYETKALMLGDSSLELYAPREAAGYLNFAHPIAVPLPRWKSRWSAIWSQNAYTFSNYVNYVSSYEDRGTNLDGVTSVPLIDPFLTWDMSFLWRFTAGVDLTVYALNLTDQMPPWTNIEMSYDGFTHDPKGRRFKAALRWRFGG